jgi:hypothetical protein
MTVVVLAVVSYAALSRVMLVAAGGRRVYKRDTLCYNSRSMDILFDVSQFSSVLLGGKKSKRWWREVP